MSPPPPPKKNNSCMCSMPMFYKQVIRMLRSNLICNRYIIQWQQISTLLTIFRTVVTILRSVFLILLTINWWPGVLYPIVLPQLNVKWQQAGWNNLARQLNLYQSKVLFQIPIRSGQINPFMTCTSRGVLIRYLVVCFRQRILNKGVRQVFSLRDRQSRACTSGVQCFSHY